MHPGGVAASGHGLNGSTASRIGRPAVDRDEAWEAAAVKLAERSQAAVWASPLASRAIFRRDHPLFAGFLPPRQPLSDRLRGHDVVLGAPVFTYHVHTGGDFVSPGTRLFQLTDDGRPRTGRDERPLHPPPGAGACWSASSLRPARRRRGRAAPPSPRPANPRGIRDARRRRLMPRDANSCGRSPATPCTTTSEYDPGTAPSTSAPAAAWGGIARRGGRGPRPKPSRKVICSSATNRACLSSRRWSTVRIVPVTFVVLNNGEYAALKAFTRTSFRKRTGPTLDFESARNRLLAVARGYGCAASRVERAAELEEKSSGTRSPCLSPGCSMSK